MRYHLHSIPAACTIALLLLVLTGGLSPVDGQDDGSEAYQKAYSLVLDSQWEKAGEALDRFLEAYQESPWRDDALFWQCHVREKQDDPLEHVFDCYQAFIADHPRSQWSDDAQANIIRIGRRLVESGHDEYRPIIKSLQQSDNEDIALTALYALRESGGENVLPTIINLYDSTRSERFREKYTYVLSGFDSPKVIPALAEIARNDPSVSVRRRAVHALGQQEHPEAQGIIKELARSAEHPEVRGQILMALSNASAREMLPELTEWAKSGRKPVARSAFEVMTRLKGVEHTLEEIARNGQLPQVRVQAARLLANRAGTEALPLLADLLRQETDGRLQRFLIPYIAQIGTPEAFKLLREVYGATDHRQLQIAILQSMPGFKSSVAAEEAQAFLMGVALDATDEIGRAALMGLSGLPTDWRVRNELLMQIAQKAQAPSIKAAALQQLHWRQGPTAGETEALAEMLRAAQTPDVQKAAIRALAQSKKRPAVEALADIARADVPADIRKRAISALGQIGTEEAQQTLEEILSDTNE